MLCKGATNDTALKRILVSPLRDLSFLIVIIPLDSFALDHPLTHCLILPPTINQMTSYPSSNASTGFWSGVADTVRSHPLTAALAALTVSAVAVFRARSKIEEETDHYNAEDKERSGFVDDTDTIQSIEQKLDNIVKELSVVKESQKTFEISTKRNLKEVDSRLGQRKKDLSKLEDLHDENFERLAQGCSFLQDRVIALERVVSSISCR